MIRKNLLDKISNGNEMKTKIEMGLPNGYLLIMFDVGMCGLIWISGEPYSNTLYI